MAIPSKPSPPSSEAESAGGTHHSGTSAPIPRAFNQKDLMDRMMDDNELARKIVRSFLVELPKQVTALRSAIQAADCPKTVQLAHRLKGAAGTLGGELLQRLAAQMELAGRAGEGEKLGQFLPELEPVSRDLIQALSAFVSQ